MPEPIRIVVVCGYGCDLRSPLTPYLGHVALFCEEQKPDYVILCGGATQQKSFPGRTEADVMNRYLREQLEHVEDWHPGWYVEDQSYTTYDNIEGARRVIDHLRTSDDWPEQEEITIFCEATRALKVAYLARHFLGLPGQGRTPAYIQTDSWERMHPFWELVGTLKDAAAIYVPGLNMLQRWQRMRKSLTR